MRQKPKTSLSSLQRKRLFRITAGVAFVAVLWLLFAPEKGLVHLNIKSRQLAQLETESKILVQENSDMTRDIERLQSDKEYLEQVAREEHGMLKSNEMVFDFNKKKDKKKIK